MRKIENLKWIENAPKEIIDESTGDKKTIYQEKEVDLAQLISIVINNALIRNGNDVLKKNLSEKQIKAVEAIPQGFDGMVFNNAVANTINNARKEESDRMLVFEESEYEKIREILRFFSAAEWGNNPDIFKAVTAYMNAEKY